jgi:hypothetical protein
MGVAKLSPIVGIEPRRRDEIVPWRGRHPAAALLAATTLSAPVLAGTSRRNRIEDDERSFLA